MSEYIMILLLIVLAYMMVYALVDRICKSREQIAITKAFGECQKSGDKDIERLSKMIDEFVVKQKGNGKGV